MIPRRFTPSPLLTPLRRFLLAGVTLTALAVPLPAFGARTRQAAGELRGRVTDELGGLIVGATLTLTDAAGALKTVSTDGEGVYVFPRLPPGRYALRAEARGFAPFESADVEVKPGGRESFDIRLSVALQKEEVTVGASNGLSTASESNAGAVVLGPAELEALPDDPDELASALQALAGPSAGPSGGEISVDNFAGGRVPPKSSIREVRINSNPFSAEYSRLGFGRIEIFTKPGTDKFHGQANLNFSNQSLNSRNPFARSRGPYRFLLYGASLSGPVVAGRASFFLDFERRDVNDNSVVNATVLDPSLAVKPFSLAVVVPLHRTILSPRLDYQINRKNTLVARYTFFRQSQQNAGVGNFSLPSLAYDAASTEQSAQLTETAVLGERAVNETRFQYSHRAGRQRGEEAGPTINVLDAFIGGGSPLGLTSTSVSRFELQNNTNFALGRQTLRAGARLARLSVRDISPLNFGGTYTFAGGAAPLLDANNQVVFERDAQAGGLAPVLVQISSLERYRRTLLFQQEGLAPEEVRARGGGATQFSINAGNPEARVSQAEFSLFVQDDWNPRPDLSLSAGLRYDTQGNVRGRLSLAPRVAAAYAPGAASGGKAKTVIRAGFGLFYDRLDEGLVLQARRLGGANEQQFVSADPNVLGLFPAVPPPALLANSAAPRTVVRLDPNLRLPYFMQSAVGVERQLPLKFVLAATFLNTRGLHLLRSRNINAPLPGQPEGAARPLGDAAGNVFEYESGGRFDQNQLIVNLRNPASSVMSVGVTYVLSKAESDTDGPNTFPANSYDLRGEYGRSDLDVRHRLNITGVFSLRGGFSLNPFILASSGGPFNIFTGLDTNGDTLFTERPSFATNSVQPGLVVTRFGALNPNPRPGERLIPRNYGTSPAFFTVNLRASKTWGFGATGAAAARKPRTRPQAKQPGGKSKSGASRNGGGAGAGSILPDSGRSDFFGRAPEGRYKLTFSVVARNIFNRTNPGRPVGNLDSLLFGQSNYLAPPFGFGAAGESNAANRRVEAQIRFAF